MSSLRITLVDPRARLVTGRCLGTLRAAPTEPVAGTRHSALIDWRGPSPAFLVAKPQGGTARDRREVMHG